MTKIWEDNPFSQSNKLWQIRFTCKEGEISKWEEFFEEKALSFSSLPKASKWITEVIVDEEPDLDLFPKELNFEYSLLEDKDWLNEVAADIGDVETELFHIIRDGAKSSSKIPLIINNARAFGMGDHITTIGCLKGIEYIYKNIDFDPQNILDVGTGTGILAIAAKKLWPKANGFGIDIDIEAIEISKNHAKINNTNIEFRLDIKKYENKKFDLILANILANPLIELSKNISDMMDNSFLVLSGFTKSQFNEVEEAYKNFLLSRVAIFEENNWVILILKK